MTFPHLFLLFYVISIYLLRYSNAQAQGWNALPFNAPCLPLAVRSPYLNAWLNQGPKSDQLNALWPNLWTTKSPTIVGWAAAIQVDNTTFSILGGDTIWPNTSVQRKSHFTPTRTIFDFEAGPVNITASFLSPINTTDLGRQSLPFTYFYMNVTSNDGNAHDIRLYSDITAEWVSGDLNSVVDWSVTNENGVILLQTQRQTIAGFSEINDHAEDVTAYYSTLNQPGVTYKIDQGSSSRGQFISNGTLDGGVDQNFRSISQDFPVFAISINLGNIERTSSHVVWGLGLLRNPAIRYTTSTGQTQERNSYFWSQYTTPLAAVEFSLSDFNESLSNAAALDAQILEDASQYSSEYADILALTVRQAMGPIEITLARDGSGDWNISDVKAFMKNLGSGNGGVNEVDVLYAAFPAYLYLNPQLGKYLLAPLLEFQESSQYKNEYAAQNLGTNYPNATGNTAAHNLGIEESANMLIMVLAHAQATGDPSLVVQHYNILKSWGDYLVQNALSPNSQITDDALVGINQTNLAIKGIIGIGAMAKISEIIHEESDSAMFQNQSISFVRQWEVLATSVQGDHLLAEYGDQSSSVLMYNLYADKLLQLNLIPQSIYDGQNDFYGNQFDQESNKYGLPVDSGSPSISRTDWMMLTAGSLSDISLQLQFVAGIHQYASINLNNTPFALSYDINSGVANDNIASPAQGALFSLLAVNQTIRNASIPSIEDPLNNSSGANEAHHTNVGAIVGGVIGGIAGLAIIFGLLFLFHRRRHSERSGGHVDFTIEPNPMLSLGSYVGGSVPESQYELIATSSDPFSNPVNIRSSPLTPENSPSFEQLSRATNSQQGLSGHSSNVVAVNPDLHGSVTTTTSQASSDHVRQQGHIAKQTLVNEQLRSEVENLRQQMERLRVERVHAVAEEAPPSYVPYLEERN